MARGWILALVAAWLGVMALSVVTFQTSVPEGSGFTFGIDRAFTFLAWQAGALLIAMLAGFLTLRLPRPRDATVMAIGLVPGSVSIMLVLLLGALVAWAALSPPAPVEMVTPGAPTTVPAN